ncbi:MAG: hypothetical protein CL610_19190 [Anaerolineaceae bacterium]|nr:hypothetical protein [Anaerolineaceae bacterium]
MSSVKLQAARELIVDDHFEAARAVLNTMPTSPTAKKWLAKLNEIAPAAPQAADPVEEQESVSHWEYLEVYVKASERMLTDFDSVIAERPVTTVDHFYTRLLNQYGEDGWELVSEELQGGDYYRLLFKRPQSE